MKPIYLRGRADTVRPGDQILEVDGTAICPKLTVDKIAPPAFDRVGLFGKTRNGSEVMVATHAETPVVYLRDHWPKGTPVVDVIRDIVGGDR